jgi:hypothetical protein
MRHFLQMLPVDGLIQVFKLRLRHEGRVSEHRRLKSSTPPVRLGLNAAVGEYQIGLLDVENNFVRLAISMLIIIIIVVIIVMIVIIVNITINIIINNIIIIIILIISIINTTVLILLLLLLLLLLCSL